jgi:hypothetical protein
MSSLNDLILGKTKSITSTLGSGANPADFDPLREIGMDRGKKLRERRLQAMADAKTFTAEKEAAHVELEAAVKLAYYTTYEQYAKAGNPIAKCKAKAIEAATIQKNMGEEAIEDEFGSDNTTRAEVKQVAVAQAAQTGIAFKSK